MAKKLEAELKISGDLDASLRQAIQNAEKNMEQLTSAAKQGEGAMGALNDMIRQQSRTLKAAQTQYASYALSGDEATAEARELAQGISALTSDLNRNKAAFSAAEKAAKGLSDSLDDVDGSANSADSNLSSAGNQARRTSGDMDLLKGAAAGVAAYGFSKLVGGAKDAMQALWSLSETTREYRQDMAALETAYSQTNFTAQQAHSTVTDLYAIFGEDDRAVETANNIARMAHNQKDLNDWVRITTGAWGVYQDALPVENLAEAAGETAKTGKVVGSGMADALNWSSKAAKMFAKYMGGDVVTAEDAFNVALSECSTEQERQALITDTLLKLYGGAADEYERASGSLMDANRATLEAEEAQAALADAMEPANIAWLQLKTQLMEAVAPAIEIVANKLADVMNWLKEHPAVLNGIIAVLGILAAAIVVVTGVVAVFTAVQMAANLSLLPVILIAGLITVAIGALIFIGYELIKNWDTIKDTASRVWKSLKKTWEGIKRTVSNAVHAVVNTIKSVWGSLVGIVSGIWNSVSGAISGVWNSIRSKAHSFANGVVGAISGAWGSLTGILTAPFNAVFGVINSVSSAIDGLISKAHSGSGRTKDVLLGWLPGFATGGFTDGISIAGEAGTEAILSFDPRYRSENLEYWAKAGRMLGADRDDFTPLSSSTSSNTSIVGDIHFEPKITVTGNADKKDIIAAIRETYPEFVDLVEQVLHDREVGVYA